MTIQFKHTKDLSAVFRLNVYIGLWEYNRLYQLNKLLNLTAILPVVGSSGPERVNVENKTSVSKSYTFPTLTTQFFNYLHLCFA